MKKIKKALADYLSQARMGFELAIEKLARFASPLAGLVTNYPKPGVVTTNRISIVKGGTTITAASKSQLARVKLQDMTTLPVLLSPLDGYPSYVVARPLGGMLFSDEPTPSFDLFPLASVKKVRAPALVDIQGAADILGITVSTLRGYRSRQIIDITSVKTPDGLRFQAREVRAEKKRRELAKQA